MDKDITVKCVEATCETPNKEFIVTASEQASFKSKSLSIPKRCKQCRINRKNRADSPFSAIAKQFEKKTAHAWGAPGDEKTRDKKKKRFDKERMRKLHFKDGFDE